MEVEKAAEYYDELVRKGGNAAKYKHGLGFGTHETSVSKGKYGGFVKEASPGKSAALDKEIRIEGIRDKLKKRKVESVREGLGSRSRSRDDPAGRKQSGREAAGDASERNAPDDREANYGERSRSRVRGRSLSLDSEKAEKAPLRRVSEERGGRSHEKDNDAPVRLSRSSSYGGSSPSSDRGDRSVRRRDRSVSPADDGRGRRRRKSPSRSERGRNPSRSHRERRSDRRRYRSRSRGRDAGGRSPGRSGRGRGRSGSPADNRKGQLRNSSSPTRRRRRSPSRSRGERGRDRSRSRSRGRALDYRRERARSPYDSYRSRSRSPRAFDTVGDHPYSGRTGQWRSGFRGSRGRYEDDSQDDRSFTKRRIEAGRSRRSTAKENRPDRDYADLIPDFESMTPAEKVKATMKLQLAETVVKDQADGISNEWERFDFDKNAPLDDDAKLDYFGDGTGAKDDTIFLKNTGSTYLSSSNQVKREELVAAAHEAAIFGPPEGLSIRTAEFEDNFSTGKKFGSGAGLRPGGPGETFADHQRGQTKASTASSNFVSEQVVEMQKAGSWQERAQRMRDARKGYLANT